MGKYDNVKCNKCKSTMVDHLNQFGVCPNCGNIQKDDENNN